MPKVILFPSKECKSKTSLKTSDLDLPKRIQEMEMQCQKKLKETAQKDYIEVVNELKLENEYEHINPTIITLCSQRQRFLNKVKDSFEQYLFDISVPNTDGAYYLLLFYMIKSRIINSVRIDDDDNVCIVCESNEIAKIIKLVLTSFYKSHIEDKSFTSIESVLKTILM